mmetsp:Transcript_8740/g.21226  ORF Transcript_8740/g.21226 Transcript_8740/m.21226 type:complete len:516 (+) Transcript_8740:712-2259(+)|eukprot:CAMPEP_0178992734 /NCGR_PEP_ID=MMETSP0795-20121207/6284_1 /TAXON_ID=88552 /ORGANISM="Amoebophrya sp., Strain Ameob2" /LENGTH=515 /DNA_ID=CAMNT_0020684659 /DNA_START=684 /DNA_END=2231 /DNA_ORIENTATION=+
MPSYFNTKSGVLVGMLAASSSTSPMFVQPVAAQAPAAKTTTEQIHSPKRRGERVKWIELVHHTFRDGNLTDHGLALWHLESCAIPLADEVQLFTDVSERSGQLWNREAITTDNWEVQWMLDFKTMNIMQKTKGVGLGFWLTGFNVNEVMNAKKIVGTSTMGQADKDWNTNLHNLGYDFLGHDTTLKGFGLILSVDDETGNTSPNLSCVRTPRKQKLEMGKNFPDKNALKVDFRNQPLDFRVRVKGNTVEVDYRPGGSHKDWKNVCSIRDYDAPKRTYMGWSAWSGTPKEKDQGSQGDFRLAVKKIKTWNYNLATVGSEMSGVAEEIRELYGELHKKNFMFDSQKEQTEAINGILKMLKTYIMGSHKAEEGQARTLLHVKSQMLDMEANALKLKKEIHYVLENTKEAGDNSPAAKKARHDRILNELRKEMGSIKKVIQTSEDDGGKMSSVSEAAAKAASADKRVMGVADQTEKIKETAENQMRNANFMNSLVLLTLIGIIGMIAHKIIYYEKKHLL